MRDATARELNLVWPRRAGKDDLTLRGTSVKLLEKPGNYWHMLPKVNQCRKAIWNAVNPKTGKRRIDEAFPHAIRETTRDQDMLIRFINGSTWQCLGSDSYEAHIGSPPVGIVYSEYAQTNPAASAYLRPIIAENGGWECKIGTPRGKNHFYRSFKSALTRPDAFAQLLTIDDTQTLTPEQLEAERQAYIDQYGYDMGVAIFLQEYYCSWDTAIPGQVYGQELRDLEEQGRLANFPHNPELPVFAALDIGHSDSTAIWFWQDVMGTPRIIDHIRENRKAPDWYAGAMKGEKLQIDIVGNSIQVSKLGAWPEHAHRQAYDIRAVFLPHDARARTFAAKGKTVQEQFMSVFDNVYIVPNLSLQDGIAATRGFLRKACFHEPRTRDGYEAVKQYRYRYDEQKQDFSPRPEHDWTSHDADALRYMAIAYEHKPEARKKPDIPELGKIRLKGAFA